MQRVHYFSSLNNLPEISHYLYIPGAVIGVINFRYGRGIVEVYKSDAYIKAAQRFVDKKENDFQSILEPVDDTCYIDLKDAEVERLSKIKKGKISSEIREINGIKDLVSILSGNSKKKNIFQRLF